MLDDAHVGDIEGAFGRIRHDDDPSQPRSVRARLLTLLAIMGPGLIVMVGDNDAGGVSTYAQAGQNYGYSLLWILVLLIPVLVVNQEMVVRLGAVTGVGHARLINERFGRFWGWFSVVDLFVLNFLTIVTEFIGVDLALGYFGVSPFISVPVAAVGLVAIAATGSFRRWERFMMFFIIVSLGIVPLGLLSHPRWGSIAVHLAIPGVRGGLTSTAILLVIAIVGTTVAPWQLFFQQSNVVDKRITPRFINYERADTFVGAFIVVLGAGAIMIAAAYAVAGTAANNHFTNAAGVARALALRSPFLGSLFAVILLDASIVGAAALTLSTSYAFGDVFGLRHSLHRGFSEARSFYLSYAALVGIAAAVVLIPGVPLGLIVTAVQALAGILLPSASVFLLLLCNDVEVLGPWVNPRWLNGLAALIVGTLLLLSGTLVAATLFPNLSVRTLVESLAAGIVTALLVVGFALSRARRRGRAARPVMSIADRNRWRMPQLALLKPVVWSPGLRMGMLALRAYLIVAVVLLVVKAVQLATGG